MTDTKPNAPTEATKSDSSITDNAVYVDGKRTAEPRTLDETFEVMREHHGVAWIDMVHPDRAELQAVADELSLHHLAVTDALTGHQRSKLERYGETLFVVLRPAKYLDDVEKVKFSEVHVFMGPDFVVSVKHGDFPDIGAVRKRLEEHPELLSGGPRMILYGIMDLIVDDYAPVIAGLENDIDEIEDQLFSGDREVSRRIYDLLREVIEFQRATHPLEEILRRLLEGLDEAGAPGAFSGAPGAVGGAPDARQSDSASASAEHSRAAADEKVLDEDSRAHSDLGVLEVKRHLRDVLDHVLRVIDRSESFRTLLQNALTVHSTLIAQKQNDEMTRMTETSLAQGEQVKKISSWAAVLFAPTLVAAIYGMNFTNMPELKWFLGYPFALALMLASGVGLYFVFKRRGWL
ncbi:magnesium and cobalt transport protein CorA [Subtercola endophyticus]|uniref:magnesium and cobalt transport protein CorA n=1 Tax=Subtercola endophyticus TaxID=2895559 RepID=UPI001E4B8C6D|nr:magnesium and cobalt transport protein CorA [Subtercola endophyticus]UFS58428.1 magnesium and cobalt transport protein CorA [Subtercola endophyticus]